MEQQLLRQPLRLRWELTKSPAGASQWRPKDGGGAGTVPDPETGELTRPPTMLTTDLSLRVDPVYEQISRGFHENPDQFADAFAQAWFKLTHRDMGPIQRYLGPWVPQEELLWQDPVPATEHEVVDADGIAAAKQAVLDTGLTVPQLVATAWASASTFRISDKRGGANGARIRLEPQSGGRSTNRHSWPGSCALSKEFRQTSRVATSGSRSPTSSSSQGARRSRRLLRTADSKANLLGLTAPQMTVLVGGLRVLGANAGGSSAGVLTDRVGTLSNDFFTNLLGMDTVWSSLADDPDSFEARDLSSGQVRWTGTRADLVFGSNSELRALAEVYAADDAQEKFVRDFVAAWDTVMMGDRYDLT